VEVVRPQTPEAVVRTFIESWNTQDFALEYACLDPDFVKNVIKSSEEDYIKQRRDVYRDLSQGGTPPKQSLEKILSKQVAKNSATIKVIKREGRGKTLRRFLDQYVLEKKEEGWFITGVKSRAYHE
jgi:hypothetical protein